MSEDLTRSLFGDDSDSEAELTNNNSQNNHNNNHEQPKDNTNTTQAPINEPTSTEAALQSLFGDPDSDDEPNKTEINSNNNNNINQPDNTITEIEVEPKTSADAALQAELFGDEDDETSATKSKSESQDGILAENKSSLLEEGIDEEMDEDIIREKQAINSKKNAIIAAKAEGEPVHIKVTRPSLPNNKARLILFKLPNLLGIDSQPFDPNTHEPQKSTGKDDTSTDDIYSSQKPIDLSDSTFQQRLERTRASQMMLENVIRHRIITDKDGNKKRESNARIIEWSNGTRQLWIGSEAFEIKERSYGEDKYTNLIYSTNQGRLDDEENQNNTEDNEEDEEMLDEDEPSLLNRSLSNQDSIQLTVRDKNKLKAKIRQSVGQISSYYNFAVTGIESKSHMKLKTAVAELHLQGPKLKRQFEAVDYDKMKSEGEELARQEELKQLRRQKKEQQATSYAYKPSTLSKGFLEDDDDEEELHESIRHSSSSMNSSSAAKKRRYDDENNRAKLAKAKEQYDMEDDFIASEDDDGENNNNNNNNNTNNNNNNNNDMEDDEEAELHPLATKPRRSAAPKPKVEDETTTTTPTTPAPSNNNNNVSSSTPATTVEKPIEKPAAEDEEFVLKKTEKAKRRALVDDDDD